MTDPETIARIFQRLDDIEDALNKEVQERHTAYLQAQIDAQIEKNKQLRFGLMAVGAVFLAVGGWAWQQVQEFFSLTVGPPE